MANGVWLWRFGGWLAVVAAAAVLAVGAGCSSDGPVDGVDGAVVDAAVVDGEEQATDSSEASSDATDAFVALSPEQIACTVKGTDCVKATWSNSGTCVVTPRTGEFCGTEYGVCAGECSSAGQCVFPGQEIPCSSYSCSQCNGKGQCVAGDVGAYCTAFSPGQVCRKPAGKCAPNGVCALTIDVGASCEFAKGPCGSGVCDADGQCVPIGAGKPCVIAAAGPCHEAAGFCGKDGVCATVLKAVGQACAVTDGCGGACNAAGQCVTAPGADCTVKYGECAGKPGVCSTSGYCLGVDECAKPGVAVPCGDFAKGLTCDKKSIATSGGTCWSPPAMPPVNSGTCGDDGDPCRPKFCKTLDSDATFTCKVGQLNDSTPCPGDAGNPCAASTCQAGKCTPAFKPAGSSCKPLAPTLCAEFQCSSAGKCEPVPASVPLAAPCTVSDGDTDCWVKSCDNQGNCTKVPRAKGEHCGAELDNACAKFACDGKGRCLVDLVATNGQCKDARCLDYYAKPGTSCTGGPCTDNGCTALGICATKYKPVGAPCEIWGYPGTCDASHVCVWPSKVLGGIVGSTCYGTFPCMKEGVAYGADGVCHGTVAVGAACGSLCNPGICGADGSCQQAFAPKGVACADTSKCGKLVCDGKGGCGFPDADVGKACTGSPPVQCNKYGCDTQGQCVLWPVSDTPCTLAKAVECNTGVCAKGVCAATPSPGLACGKDTACMAYSCSASGQCVGTPKTGASCESTETCKVGVCDATGQCKQVVAPGKKCVGKQQCMEGTCNASGGCDLALKPAGSQCTAAAPGTDWSCYTGVCDSKGGCSLKINTGAKCMKGAGPCTEGVCQSDASCKKVPANLGKACSATCVPTGVCNALGECAGNPATGQTCYDQCVSNGKCSDKGKCTGTVMVGGACGAWASAPICQQNTCNSDGSCTTKNLAAGKACTVGATFYEATPSYACGSSVGVCDGAGTCLSTKPDPDGTACGFDDGCAAAHVCKGGFCVPVEPMDGNSPCKFGCATGKCIAGVCDAPLTLQTKDSDPCSDGDPCTDDLCGSSGLPYLAVPYNWTPAGKCSYMPNVNCINGKLPKPTPSCPPCGYDLCGSLMYCEVDYAAGTANCVVNSSSYPISYEGYPAECDDKNPCTKDGCANGGCAHTSNGSGGNCAPFKHCKDGQCIPWN